MGRYQGVAVSITSRWGFKGADGGIETVAGSRASERGVPRSSAQRMIAVACIGMADGILYAPDKPTVVRLSSTFD